MGATVHAECHCAPPARPPVLSVRIGHCRYRPGATGTGRALPVRAGATGTGRALPVRAGATGAVLVVAAGTPLVLVWCRLLVSSSSVVSWCRLLMSSSDVDPGAGPVGSPGCGAAACR